MTNDGMLIHTLDDRHLRMLATKLLFERNEARDAARTLLEHWWESTVPSPPRGCWIKKYPWLDQENSS